MWFESQNCAMMGLQATPTKRKLESATVPGDSSPPKTGRWDADDCIARLQAVAVPVDAWRSPTPSLAATLLSSDEFDAEDDDFDDESDDDRCVSVPPESAKYHQLTTGTTTILTAATATASAAPSYHQPSRYGGAPPAPHQAAPNNDYWQYYHQNQHQPVQQVQQTIRCEENGKSYLELGTSPSVRRHLCCDGKSRWCHYPCYRQRRLAVLNLSMCKLARYRQCSDPSLRRSVLICNTLRRLEREMESDPIEAPSPSAPPPTSNYQPHIQTAAPSATLNSLNGNHSDSSYEINLREMSCSSGRMTPFPANPVSSSSSTSSDLSCDSGLGDDEMTKPINWSSVLSLSSQTDLESLNNNEFYAELGLVNNANCSTSNSHAGIENEWKMDHNLIHHANSGGNEWDGFMQHVLVGGTT